MAKANKQTKAQVKEVEVVNTKLGTHRVVTKEVQDKVDSYTTKAAKIRYLDSQNYSRSDIAKIVGCIYQQVRNTLITPISKPKEK